MPYREVLYDADGAIAFLTLNNAAKINALSRRMIAEIIQVLQQLEADESIKVLIVRAAGDHFCAGHSLDEMVDQNLGS